MAAGVLAERGRPDFAFLGRARLQVPTNGGIDEIPLHPVRFEPSEYVAGSLTSRKQFYYNVTVLFHRAR